MAAVSVGSALDGDAFVAGDSLAALQIIVLHLFDIAARGGLDAFGDAKEAEGETVKVGHVGTVVFHADGVHAFSEQDVALFAVHTAGCAGVTVVQPEVLVVIDDNIDVAHSCMI